METRRFPPPWSVEELDVKGSCRDPFFCDADHIPNADGEAMSDDAATAIKCPLCAVTVPADKVDLPNRCLHPRCPLHRDQSK